MNDCGPDAGAVFLQPEELITADGPVRVKTVVGSCLAITVRAPRLGLSAMAHCVLPEAGNAGTESGGEGRARYVDTAIQRMLEALSGRGALASDLEIKIFGGADSMEAAHPGCGYRVGGRNIDMARAVLAARGLSLAASVVGGSRGRVLIFDTQSGDVFVKTLPSQVGRAPELL